MGYTEIENFQEIVDSSDKLKILLDSNVLIAYLDEDHKFNYEAKTIIDPLKNEDCYFIVHYIAIGEFINKWMEIKKVSVGEAIKTLRKFMNTSLKYSFSGGVPLNSDLILSSFTRHAKHKNFLKAHFNDFMILTEAETIKNIKIVTCDKAMCEAGKAIFKKDIYYLPFKTKRGRSELGRFISDIEKVNL